MKNLRFYGQPPYIVAVVHGGPGAAGEMAPVARELASGWGVLEPLQTATSIDGQVQELKTLLEAYGDPPLTLVGFSWGAWLGSITAARHPALVAKLILVGSGPFEEQYATGLLETRLERLGEAERREVQALLALLDHPALPDAPAELDTTATEDKQRALARLGALLSRADVYDPVAQGPGKPQEVDVQVEIFERVWPQAAALRRSGGLLALAGQIRCPVVAIHGDRDPHPAEGVQAPLSAVLDRFRLILLQDCGHKPWIERRARARFYEVLREELPFPIA